MNIIFITNHLNIGGISSYVLTLGKGLKPKNHNVYIASSGGELLPIFKEEGFIYIPIPIKTKKEISPKILVSMFKLSAAIDRFDIGLIHSHSRTTQVLGCLLGKLKGIPHVYTCHGFFKRRFLRRVFPCWGKKVIAISEPVKEHLMQDFDVNEKDIRVIYNGIDVARFKVRDGETRNSIKNNLGLGDGPVVGIVARLSDVKGHIYLVEAMKDVLERMPRAQLAIVGEGTMKEELVRLVTNLGIEKNVFFIPQVLDTTDVLSAMDLFVMPSLKEGLGLALMEAMAAGLAVIGSDVGGIRILIQDGSTGLLVKPKDAAALSRAILALLSDEEKRKYLGKNARDFIIENFSQEKMVGQTERLYLECLSEKD